MNKHTNNQSGVTLIELIVVSVLLALIASAILGLQYILTQNREVTVRNYLNVDNANRNLTMIEREIRTAQLSASGAYPLVTAQDNELTFYSDVDFDGVIERVRYTRTDNTLTRGVIKPTGQPPTYLVANESERTLSTDIQNDTLPVFYFYNGDWPTDTDNNPLATPATLSEIKLIRIYLQINSDNDSPETDYVLDSVSSIRMLKDNL